MLSWKRRKERSRVRGKRETEMTSRQDELLAVGGKSGGL